MRTVASWLDTIGQVFRVIPDLATPEQVQSALREILEDPALELYWWDWELERYVDVRGTTWAPDGRPGAATTWVGYETRKIGAVVPTPVFSRMRSSGDLRASRADRDGRDRLHRDLIAKLEQLKASRLRILQAATTRDAAWAPLTTARSSGSPRR
jgi:hypothetical protein